MVISSTANSTVKQIRALRHRRDREQTALFFVEGIRIVGEAVAMEAPVQRCVVAPDLLDSDFAGRLVVDLQARGVPCLEVTGGVFRSISVKENPQGIGAVVRQRWERLEDILPGAELCWIALDGVQDPGNLGSIVRTADAVGAAGLILVGATTDPHDPAAVRGSMGAIFSQKLVRAGVQQLATWKKAGEWRVVGTSDSAAHDYRGAAYDPPLVLFMGSERQGLSAEELALCDEVVRIPMVGHSDSLNLAVATGVVLYEAFNRRRGEVP